MQYGFVIDNRKCIGCHACTTACKSEHQVPVGVNRTWVKQVEKGTFPHTRRLFSVMRCNHCTDAPCVEICPVEALFTREDGIVDFNKDRCIGCKSCMQACPYDALYIDPENHTAAKCNYCAHRVDIGLEPACVNVCPEHAIISGDMDDSNSEISQLLARQQVAVRKPEKGTHPNLFYIDADEASLNPGVTNQSEAYYWNSQSTGVGHFAKEAEKLAFSNGDVLNALLQDNKQQPDDSAAQRLSIEILTGKARRTYDAPNKGILWGWEVSGYVLTKAIATGAFLVPFIAWVGQWAQPQSWIQWTAILTGMIFLGLTGLLLVKDLDRPDRFLNVLFRPQWKSWLVRGGYAISFYGLFLGTLAVLHWFEAGLIPILYWLTAGTAVVVSVYTAFLFAQAKGRDFWQSPMLALHMLIHTILAGASIFALFNVFATSGTAWTSFLGTLFQVALGISLITILLEIITPHPTLDAKKTVSMITKGRYKVMFWGGVIAFGHLIPLGLISFFGFSPILLAGVGILVLFTLYLTEHIWIEAPQRLPLS